MSIVSVGTVRKVFGKIKDVVPIPNLVEIQSSSFNDFVQLDMLPEERANIGLEKVLRDIFPIDYEDKLSLQYVSYELGMWACACGKLSGIVARYQWQCQQCNATGVSRLKSRTCPQCQKKGAFYKHCVDCLTRVVVRLPMTVDECRISGQTFSMPLKVKMQLISWDIQPDGSKKIHDIKEQDIFFVDLPVMVDLYQEDGVFKLGNFGTFLINGIDRVVVSQLHRSPGVVFSQSKKIKDYRGKPYYLARLIPMRGSWMDFEFDSNDLLYVRIDKKKKMLVTTFLQALGLSRQDIVKQFYKFDTLSVKKGEYQRIIDDTVIGQRIEKGMLPAVHEKEFIGQRISLQMLAKFKKFDISHFVIRENSLLNRVVGQDFINTTTGEIIFEQGEVITESHLEKMRVIGDGKLVLIQSSGYVFQPVIALTLTQDKCMNYEDALKEVHAKLWPGDSASVREIKERLDNLFFNSRFYDLTKVGRMRINRKFGLTTSADQLALTNEDIFATIAYLVNLREKGEGILDDIDHLGNRRVRLVGELLFNQMYLGFMRVERIVRERFRIQEAHNALMPQDLLNVKPISAVHREFFGSGQLSQFNDQTNPLSDIAHKTRLSALGPGGVMKDRATFEVRDVHTSHYGRICPIKTPEGQTVGLISSFSIYATVNEYGFIETPYRTVKNKKVQDEVVYFDAFEESEKYIAQADAIDSVTGGFMGDKVPARYEGDFVAVEADKISYVDLSPKQLVSVSAALIPFLEHDDAVRALMGSNMQQQAVPLIKPEAPIVGTGVEVEIVKASGAVLTAKRAGVVDYVSSSKIVIRATLDQFDSSEDWIASAIDTYHLKKFQRSSYSTWIHHEPIVKVGDHVEVGDILTNGSAVKNGELALGKNLLVAFMPWNGFNFEDAIVVSRRLVSDDVFTSVHIDEYLVDSRDTKLGPEEITRDIPNVSENLLTGLDEDGIVRIGTRVKAGDILVGKVTLKGDIQYSPEEKLLRAIFGEKSREVRDTSLRVPPGVEGTVVDVKIFARGGVRRSKRYKQEVEQQIVEFDSDYRHHVKFLTLAVKDKIVELLQGQTGTIGTQKELVVFGQEMLAQMSLDDLSRLKIKSKTLNEQVKRLKVAYDTQLRVLQGLKEERINKMKRGDTLPSGVIKMVKVYIAMKRHIAVGDKIAGRHGNKGVVSVLVPREDMPYTEDGTPIDVVLNPLGIPSRMNVGQILETLLGLAGRNYALDIEQAMQAGYEDIKKSLSDVYGAELIENYERKYSQEGIKELATRTAKEGVLFKTPVFDSADYQTDIAPLLKGLKLPAAGSFKLRDGRTGEYFDQPVTVGVLYMIKLNHMVDDKLHARSVGPYSLVTQQPLGGKAKQGGQRFGEMEVWALEAYGAAYTLREMLTYKSDDVTGRHKVYQAIVNKENIPAPGVPESFNVLIKELQSLGLQVDLLKVGKEDVVE